MPDRELSLEAVRRRVLANAEAERAELRAAARPLDATAAARADREAERDIWPVRGVRDD